MFHRFSSFQRARRGRRIQLTFICGCVVVLGLGGFALTPPYTMWSRATCTCKFCLTDQGLPHSRIRKTNPWATEPLKVMRGHWNPHPPDVPAVRVPPARPRMCPESHRTEEMQPIPTGRTLRARLCVSRDREGGPCVQAPDTGPLPAARVSPQVPKLQRQGSQQNPTPRTCALGPGLQQAVSVPPVLQRSFVRDLKRNGETKNFRGTGR